MIIVAGGDSFIWGSELDDSSQNVYSHQTFTALLAKKYGFDYICAAYPGNANSAISRMAISACEQIKQDKFLIVNWTYPQRAEFRVNDKWVSINSWHTEFKEFSESYFKYVGNSEYYEIYSVLKEILFLQQYCEINKIPYLFTTADNHFYQHENYFRRQDADIDSLYNNINWHNWFWFPTVPRGFYQWALENKYNMGPKGHPLGLAHSDAAELIRSKFNELVTQHNQQNQIRNPIS